MSQAACPLEPEPPGGEAVRPVPFPVAAAGRAARREHSYQSLLQLGHDLTVSRDLFETVDLLIFNLMGQLGTGRSALWLLSEDDPPQAVLVRCHGFQRRVVEPLGVVCGLGTGRLTVDPEGSSLDWRERSGLGSTETDLALQAGLEILTPVSVHQQVLGWLALGRKADGSSFVEDDYRLLDAILGLLGASLENVSLYNRVLEANRRLSVTNDRLSEMDRLKSEFLRNVNHELRTPLTVVIGALECLIAMSNGEGPVHRLQQAALRDALRLKTMVENLLQFSDALNTRLPVHLVDGDVHETLAPYCARRLPGIAASLREMVYLHAEDLPPARYDPQRLLQILDELVDNALKFTPRGSHLRLALDRATVDGAEWVRIRFEDDGPGVPPDRIGSLFRSFEQVDGSSTRRVGGMGMGLAFARQLAEGMDCQLRADSVVGEGTTFTVLIPAA